MTFGEKLKLLRYEKGLTQDDIGYLLNVTKSCISCYENGTRQPSVDVLVELSIYFNVSIDFLLGMEKVNNKSKRQAGITVKDISLIKELKNNPLMYQEIISDIPNSVLKIREVFAIMGGERVTCLHIYTIKNLCTKERVCCGRG